MASQILRYDSESESDYSSETETTPDRKRRKIVDYDRIKTFNSVREGKQFLKENKECVYYNKYNSAEGEIIKYVCKMSPTCSFKFRLILSSTTHFVHLEKSNAEHDHPEKVLKGLSNEMKREILFLVENGTTKPKALQRALQAKELPIPSKTELNNFLKNQRSKASPPVLTLGELQAACEKLTDVPFDEDVAYVVNYFVDFESKQFGIFISTKRILEIATLSQAIHCDATYKLNWLGLPVLICGVSDMDKVFHPAGIALTSNETSDDFEFLFASLKQGVARNFNPVVLIADAAEAITKAFEKVFGSNYTRVHCWFHLTKNIDTKKHLVKDLEVWKHIRADISELQLCTFYYIKRPVNYNPI